MLTRLALAALFSVPLGAQSQQAYLKASNTGDADRFGASVGMSGDTVVVGANREDSSASGVGGHQGDDSAVHSGAAYVFVRSGTAWSQQAYLKASNTDIGDEFGYSVSVCGDTIAVGAPEESSSATGVNGNQADNTVTGSGAVYVFVRSGTTWTQQAYLKASNTGIDDGFGHSVSLSGDTLVVGAPGESSAASGVNGNEADDSSASSGAAYVFVRNGTTWAQQAYLKASNTGWGDLFGSSVDVSGDTIAVGAVEESSAATGIDGVQSDNSATSSGAAYLFERVGTTWAQSAYVKASNTDPGDRFYRVGLAGDILVVGAFAEASLWTGVGGGQSDNLGTRCGAAYVFERHGAAWSQAAYLKPSNTDSGDSFGSLVAVAGRSVVIASPSEASSASGVDGDGSDNGRAGSGAAYVFDLLPDFGGCGGAGSPQLGAPPSQTSAFGVTCPTPTSSCAGVPLIMFGLCSPAPISVPPPIGCGVCGLTLAPMFGTLADGHVFAPGLPLGARFCVQCGCFTAAMCADLSKGMEIVVGP